MQLEERVLIHQLFLTQGQMLDRAVPIQELRQRSVRPRKVVAYRERAELHR